MCIIYDNITKENRTAGTAGEDTDEEGSSSGDDGPATAPDNARLLERGVELHALSADEGDCTDDEMDSRDLTPEEAAAATAFLDAPDDNDQEGLALTGGDWFNTIKQVAKNNTEAEKELAARMKKAKISQTSLENEVFEGEPSNHSSADAGPGLLRKESPLHQFPHPPLVTDQKSGSGSGPGSRSGSDSGSGAGSVLSSGSSSGSGPGSATEKKVSHTKGKRGWHICRHSRPLPGTPRQREKIQTTVSPRSTAALGRRGLTPPQ